MEDYKRYHIPAFGNWDFENNLPITQYFESARQAGLTPFNDYATDGCDLYGVDLKMDGLFMVSPPKIKGGSRRYQYVKEPKKVGRVCDDMEPRSFGRAPKAVDEDLYKIPPELLHQKPKKKRVVGFFSRCLVPDCVA